jgi:hypothetical protein
MLSAELNHGSPRCRPAGPSSTVGNRGSVTHEAIPTGVPQAKCDAEPSGTSVRAQTYGVVRWMLMHKSSKAPKRTRLIMTSVDDTTFDVPFSKPPAPERRTSTPSPLVDQRRTCPLNPPGNNSQIPHPDSDRTLQITSLSSPQPGPKPSSFLERSRPSVIVYKVARGPNFSGSRDVIRVSYGEGYRKRTPLTNSSSRSDKERALGRRGCPTKKYGMAKGDDPTEHPNRKPIRSKLCSARRYYDEKRPPSGLRRADVSGGLPPAERFEGDMAWDFGAGPETCVRPVGADRSRVRVGGLTSVRMIPRTAVNSK